jgi:D-3-phosphoglycerate dehydrogenase
VLEKEPPDADDPILKLDNAIITPHALCWTDQMFSGIGAADVRAVLDVMQGRIPVGLVDPQVKEQPDFAAKLERNRKRFGG